MSIVIRSARRRFLARIASAAALTLMGTPLCASVIHHAARNVRRSFFHPDDAASLGRRWLQNEPAPADVASLLHQLIADTPQWRIALRSPSAVRVLAAERTALDFTQGATVELDGWVLSRTEIRLCALAALA